MAYVGNTPSRGQWRKLTDISGSFDGVTTTFTTSVPPGTSQYYVTAGTASQLIISLGGVIQEPDVDYSVSTNSITFTTAPAAGLSFFGILCGDALNTGVPSDGSITTSKLGGNLTVDLASGSAATPSLTFDSNTGLYSPGEDQVAVSTGGTGRLFIDSSGRVGIGSSTPDGTLHVQGTNSGGTLEALVLRNNATATGTQTAIRFTNSTGAFNHASIVGTRSGSGTLDFYTAGSATAAMSIDSSSRVGIGTTSPGYALDVQTASGGGIEIIESTSGTFKRLIVLNNSTGTIYNATAGVGTGTHQFQIDGSEALRIDGSRRLLVGTSTNFNGYRGQFESTDFGQLSIRRNVAGAGGPGLAISHSRGSTSGSVTALVNNDEFGGIYFYGADGTQDVPGAAIYAAVDGTPGTNDMPGRLVFSTTADGASSPTERVRITSGGFFKAQGDSSYIGSASNYHEFVSNQSNTVTLVTANQNSSFASAVSSGGCARAANSAYSFQYWYSAYPNSPDLEFNLRGDGNAYADGTWSGGGADYAEYFEWSDSNPDAEDRRGISVVLDGDKIREAVAGEDPIGVISGNPSVIGDAAWNKWSGKHLRDEYGTYILDENGDRQLNPDYDPDQKYISREQRPEWDCVGLMGKLRIRKGQVTGSRWIKMRDISDSVEEWLVR